MHILFHNFLDCDVEDWTGGKKQWEYTEEENPSQESAVLKLLQVQQLLMSVWPNAGIYRPWICGVSLRLGSFTGVKETVEAVIREI